MVVGMSEMGPGPGVTNPGHNQAQNPGQAPLGGPTNPEDPGASTQMFQAYASTRPAEPESARNRVIMLAVAAGLFVLAVVVIILLFVTS
jgi:hypothetical protein